MKSNIGFFDKEDTAILYLENQLRAKFSDDELKLLFAGFMVSYFQKRNKWSGKGMIVISVEFKDLEIIVKYGAINGHTIYKRVFFERHINEIVDFINTNKLDMSTKQLYDDKAFNSPLTITNKNIVVIKYAIEGFGYLQSMTVGDFYVAEKVVHENCEKYQLLSHNKMERSGNDFIRVKKDIDGGTNYPSGIKRFEEYEIHSWVDINDFDNTEVMLCPVLRGQKMVNPLTGRLLDHSYQLQISKTASAQQMMQNLAHKPGYGKFWFNGYGLTGSLKANGANHNSFIGVISDTTHNQNPGCVLQVTGNNVAKWVDMNAEITKTGQMYHEIMEKVINGTENDDDIERRINNMNTPIRRHMAEPNVGVKDDYLLVN